MPLSDTEELGGAAQANSPTRFGSSGSIAWALALAYLGVALATFRDFGVTWDEKIQSHYGELALRYFTSGFSDTSVNNYLDARYYGAWFETLCAAAYSTMPQAKYEIRHLCIALIAFAAIVGVIRFCALFSDRASVSSGVAVLTLVCLPQFFGHSFNNSKDIPFAATVVWMMVAWLSFTLRPLSWKATISAGITLGLMLGIRAGGIIAFAAPLAVFALSLPPGVPKRQVLGRLGAALAIAWATMVAFWPWAHQNVLLNPVRALVRAARFPRAYPVFFEGQFYPSNELPRRYLAELLTILTPIPIVVLILAGVVIAASSWLRKRDPESAMTLLWGVLPVFMFCVLRPNVYDGIRHFLFILPALAILSGIAAGWILQRARSYRIVAAVALYGAIAVSAVPMVELHPYEMTYYNALVGGTGEAAKRFETDYWASSFREAAMWIRDHRCAQKTRVLLGGNQFSLECLAYYLPADMYEVTTTDARQGGALPPPFDYYVAEARYGLAFNFPQTPVVGVIGRDGAAFSIIRGSCVK